MNDALITANKLTKVYRRGSEQVFALKDASFTVHRGEFLAIVGPSGSGKTTLLNLLGCLDRPTWGTLKLDGIEINGLKEKDLTRLRRDSIGFVFQQFFLLPTLTVKENIELPLLFSNKNDGEKVVKEIIGLVGLSNRANHLPHQLSGGEMQRVAIGRALVNSPKILLADEPTGNLDSITAETIYQLFLRLNREGLTIIVVTHNLELADIAHRVIRLKDGRITAGGAAERR
jgi:putative ABC transport system ATP-binding protein